jgi:hypothetical protein
MIMSYIFVHNIVTFDNQECNKSCSLVKNQFVFHYLHVLSYVYIFYLAYTIFKNKYIIMKKIYALSVSFLFVLLFSAVTYSQTLTFCEGVDEKGNAIKPSSTFYVSPEGSYFYFLVSLPEKVGCTHINYDLYLVSSLGDETFLRTVEQDGMETTWTWFWKEVTFYWDGEYKVYAVDCNGKKLASANVTVKYYQK